MEKTLPPAGLAPQAVDQETFERVWRRVMPDQARSPIAVGPAEGGKRPPARMEKAVRQTPTPAEEAPTRRASPPAPPPALPRNDRERLEGLMDLAREGVASGQELARRTGSRGLSTLTAERRQALRQLSAACFLVTGRQYRPREARLLPEPVLALALREQFLWEQRWARACLQAAEELEERSLQALCRELAQDAALHNRLIRRMLERMQQPDLP